jgi:hypothetical protein
MLDPAINNDVAGVAMPLSPLAASGAIGESSGMLDLLQFPLSTDSLVAIGFGCGGDFYAGLCLGAISVLQFISGLKKCKTHGFTKGFTRTQ